MQHAACCMFQLSEIRIFVDFMKKKISQTGLGNFMDFTTVNFNETVFLFGGYQEAVSDQVWTMNNDTFEFYKVDFSTYTNCKGTRFLTIIYSV